KNAAILPQQLVLYRHSLPGAESFRNQRPPLWRNQRQDFASNQLVRLIAEHGGEPVVHVEDAPVLVDANAFKRRRGEAAKAFFALPQRLLRLLPQRDVPQNALDAAVGKFRDADFDRDGGTILVPEAPFVPVTLSPAQGRQIGFQRGNIVLRDKITDMPANNFPAGPPEQSRTAPVHLETNAVAVEDENPVGRLFHQVAITLLGLDAGFSATFPHLQQPDQFAS